MGKATTAASRTAKGTSGRKIKYMGSADVRELLAGEDFGGRLAEPLTQDVVWDWNNKHVIDSAEANLSEAAVQLLTEPGSGFQDVTDHEVVPVNLAQVLWRGFKPDQDGDLEAPATDDNGALNPDGTSHGASGSVAPTVSTTTVGGAGTD